MFSYFEEHKEQLVSEFRSPKFHELATSENFLFQAAKDRFEEFRDMRVGDGVIRDLLDMVTSDSGFNNRAFEAALDSFEEDSDRYRVLYLAGGIMCYFSKTAPMWKRFNERSRKPYIIAAGMRRIRADWWIKYLLKFKSGEDVNSFTAHGIRNSILYLQDPENNITTVKKEDREHILRVVFGNNRDIGVSALIDGMRSIGIEAVQPLNNGRLCDDVLRTRPEIMAGI
jgi:hypothetical protein